MHKSTIGCHLEYNWTKTHGFFALMGGFMQHHDNGPPTVLEAKDVPSVVKRRTLEVEIQDKSKGRTIKNSCPGPDNVVPPPVYLTRNRGHSCDEARGCYVCICTPE